MIDIKEVTAEWLVKLDELAIENKRAQVRSIVSNLVSEIAAAKKQIETLDKQTADLNTQLNMLKIGDAKQIMDVVTKIPTDNQRIELDEKGYLQPKQSQMIINCVGNLSQYSLGYK